MRAFWLSLALLSTLALAQSHATGAEPEFRPALIGNGPKALVNMIDTQKLMARGQNDALIMFDGLVSRGNPLRYARSAKWHVYRGTPGSELLQQELLNKLGAAEFVPAIANHKPVDVVFHGTALFMVKDLKPHLRIYANQNHEDIKEGNDFIAPQLIIETADWQVSAFDLVLEKARAYGQNGAIQLLISVDAAGNQRDLKVMLEDPPGFGFGDAIRKTYAKAKYIPGFRNGRPVDSTFESTEYFRRWKY